MFLKQIVREKMASSQTVREKVPLSQTVHEKVLSFKQYVRGTASGEKADFLIGKDDHHAEEYLGLTM